MDDRGNAAFALFILMVLTVTGYFALAALDKRFVRLECAAGVKPRPLFESTVEDCFHYRTTP